MHTSAILAVWPISSLQVGTLRQHSSFMPEASRQPSKAARQRSRSSSSFGMKSIPAAAQVGTVV